MSFVEHHFVTTPGALPPYQSWLYDYLVGSNGIFLRSQREGLAVILPLRSCEVHSLAPVEPMIQLDYPPVPASLVEEMLEYAQAAQSESGHPVEALFHLEWGTNGWRLLIPEQVQSATNVAPVDDGPESSYARALIETHSHHQMRAFFSGTDDRDEQGFRIYAVFGNIFEHPELLVRAGCQGTFWIILADWIFELPPQVRDASLPVIRDYDDEEAIAPDSESSQEEDLRL